MASGFAGINTRETWELSQAKDAIAAVEAEAKAHGIRYNMLDCRVYRDREQRVIIQAICIRHDLPIAPDSLCEVCLRESKQVGAQ